MKLFMKAEVGHCSLLNPLGGRSMLLPDCAHNTRMSRQARSPELDSRQRANKPLFVILLPRRSSGHRARASSPMII